MRPSEAKWPDDERMSGAVCFHHPRVPVGSVFDFSAKGTMDEFDEDYPNVKPEQVRAAVEASRERIEGASRVSC